jgi:diguanylate cyclase (GGDEF)-like protein
MMDLDHFKQFNDSFGHEAGDIVLREFGTLITAQIRGSDIACRYGGEEFLVILVDATLELAQRRADSLREQVRNMQIQHRGKVLRRVTVSMGLAAFPDHGRSRVLVVNAADKALYTAKSEGRDRVVLAQSQETLGPRDSVDVRT